MKLLLREISEVILHFGEIELASFSCGIGGFERAAIWRSVTFTAFGSFGTLQSRQYFIKLRRTA